jgi:hypothetical protein
MLPRAYSVSKPSNKLFLPLAATAYITSVTSRFPADKAAEKARSWMGVAVPGTDKGNQTVY